MVFQKKQSEKNNLTTRENRLYPRFNKIDGMKVVIDEITLEQFNKLKEVELRGFINAISFL